MKRTATFALFSAALLLLTTVSCTDNNGVSSNPNAPLDDRDALITLHLQTVEREGTVEVEDAVLVSEYSHSWNPSGGPVAEAMEGIENCLFTLDGSDPLVEIRSEYTTSGQYRLPESTPFQYAPPSTHTLTASLTSLDDVYPGRYPAFTTDLHASEATVEHDHWSDHSSGLPYESAVDTFAFVLHRDLESIPEDYQRVHILETMFWREGSEEHVVWERANWLDAPGDSIVTYVEHDITHTNYRYRILVDFVANVDQETVSVVPGKDAVVRLVENRTYSKERPLGRRGW